MITCRVCGEEVEEYFEHYNGCCGPCYIDEAWEQNMYEMYHPRAEDDLDDDPEEYDE